MRRANQIVVLLALSAAAPVRAQTADELRQQAQRHDAAGRFADAVADYTKAILLDPADGQTWHRRGCSQFKAGKIAESIADFDKYIELVPKAKVSHWQRGISYYYAGRWDDGIAQFEGYQTYDSNDVENAVWRFMCMARKDGIAKARKEMLKIGADKRVPMRQIYDLYLGKLTPDEVLDKAAKTNADDKSAVHQQLFYAHLYIGIYDDLRGKNAEAFEHLRKATDMYRIGHYMWDVARVHRDILQKAMKE